MNNIGYIFIVRRLGKQSNSITSPPLILGFHPSKRHAALIASCDQSSVVLAFTLVLLIEAFFMTSNASYLDVRSMAFSRFVVLCCLSSTNIMLFFVQSRFNLMLVLVVKN